MRSFPHRTHARVPPDLDALKVQLPLEQCERARTVALLCGRTLDELVGAALARYLGDVVGAPPEALFAEPAPPIPEHPPSGQAHSVTSAEGR